MLYWNVLCLLQISTVAESEDSQESVDSVTDSQKRREILSRRPSYRSVWQLLMNMIGIFLDFLLSCPHFELFQTLSSISHLLHFHLISYCYFKPKNEHANAFGLTNARLCERSPLQEDPQRLIVRRSSSASNWGREVGGRHGPRHHHRHHAHSHLSDQQRPVQWVPSEIIIQEVTCCCDI